MVFGQYDGSSRTFTGGVLRRETFADYNLGRQVRSWMRFLHTGDDRGLHGAGAILESAAIP